jgi:hypothetical protein
VDTLVYTAAGRLRNYPKTTSGGVPRFHRGQGSGVRWLRHRDADSVPMNQDNVGARDKVGGAPHPDKIGIPPLPLCGRGGYRSGSPGFVPINRDEAGRVRGFSE